MATYTVSVTPRQDTALAYYAQKRGKTVQQVVDAEFARVLVRVMTVFDQDDAGDVARAYNEATPAKQQAIRAALNI